LTCQQKGFSTDSCGTSKSPTGEGVLRSAAAFLGERKVKGAWDDVDTAGLVTPLASVARS
jgi:hypothetical protein